jgi:hypothetical protein
MGAILNLCSRAILLEDAKKIADGDVSDVVSVYLNKTAEHCNVSYRCPMPPNQQAWIEESHLLDPEGRPAEKLLMTSPLTVVCELIISAPSRYTLSIQIKELNGSAVFHYPNGDANFALPDQPGKYRITTLLPPLLLYPGQYLLQLTLCAGSGQYFEHLHIIESLGFESEQDYALCARPLGRHAGIVYSQAEWRCESASDEVAS